MKSLSSYHLKDFLRKYEPSASTTRYNDFKPVWMNKKEYNNLRVTNSVQRNVIKRLYYDEKFKLGLGAESMKKKNGSVLPDININRNKDIKQNSVMQIK